MRIWPANWAITGHCSSFPEHQSGGCFSQTIEKFSFRFKRVEAEFQRCGISFPEASFDEMILVWNKVKINKKNQTEDLSRDTTQSRSDRLAQERE